MSVIISAYILHLLSLHACWFLFTLRVILIVWSLRAGLISIALKAMRPE